MRAAARGALAATLAILPCVAFSARLPAASEAAWCNDCGVLASLEAVSGHCPAVPDLLVDVRTSAGCEVVDAGRLRSGEAATCSLQAAVDFVNGVGDPSPGDGEILIGVTARSAAVGAQDCDGACAALAGRGARPAGGQARQRVAIENRNAERLVVAGCGVTLTGSDDGGPTVRITPGTGPVEVIGLHVEGPAEAGYRIDGGGEAVGVHQARVRATTTGIVIAGARGGTRLVGVTIQETQGEGLLVREAADIDLSELVILEPGGHGIRAVELTGRASLERGRLRGVNVPGSSALELVNSGPASAELFIDDTTFSESRTERSLLLVSAKGDSRITVSISESHFTALSGEAVQIVAAERSRVRAVVRDSSFEDAPPGGLGTLALVASGGVQEIVIEGNVFHDVARPPANAGVINLTATGGRLGGSISGNQILRSEGRRGISVISQPGGEARVEALELELEGNEIDDLAEREALFVDLRTGTERAIVRLQDNRIGTRSETPGRIGGTYEAVRIRARGSEIGDVAVSLEHNEIVASTQAPVVALDIQGPTNVRCNVRGNRLVNLGTGLAFSARAEDPESTLCLRLAENEAGSTIVLRADAGDFRGVGLHDAQERHRERLHLSGSVREASAPCWRP